jgi:Ca2+-binding EF-hand superfamily protein
MAEDKDSTGTVTFESFNRVLKSLQIPKSLLTSDKIKQLYQESGCGQEGGLDYRAFINYL